MQNILFPSQEYGSCFTFVQFINSWWFCQCWWISPFSNLSRSFYLSLYTLPVTAVAGWTLVYVWSKQYVYYYRAIKKKPNVRDSFACILRKYNKKPNNAIEKTKLIHDMINITYYFSESYLKIRGRSHISVINI